MPQPRLPSFQAEQAAVPALLLPCPASPCLRACRSAASSPVLHPHLIHTDFNLSPCCSIHTDLIWCHTPLSLLEENLKAPFASLFLLDLLKRGY